MSGQLAGGGQMQAKGWQCLNGQGAAGPTALHQVVMRQSAAGMLEGCRDDVQVRWCIDGWSKAEMMH